MARLFRIILPVADIERATTVYGELLEQPGERVSPGRHYFNCGGTILACYDAVADGDEPAEAPRYQPEQYLYIGVSDLARTLEQARVQGFEIVPGGIQRMPWGETMFWSTDPFGNPVSFVDEATLFLGSDSGSG